ncbi:dihydrofolate reductase family protein [Patescibacteria group bacterium]|nr:dihydrofolate reductase family protein [Patescibacteria group bacterium]
MKIISMYVSSIDGKITKWNRRPSEWASIEDQTQFYKALEENNLIVVGSTGYDEGIRSAKGKLLMVMTRNPQKYNKLTVPGQLEFTQESPENLVSRLEKVGYQQMLLACGPQLTTKFFDRKLIDELWVNVEPKIFGQGHYMIIEEPRDISLKLLTMQKINNQGTILLKYKVIKNK